MEELNKNQLILLTLLVSFVTSIATGIITVSLLQEAPPSVTQVINRVVERTIEQAVTTTDSEGNQETVREVTVVVKEEDQVIDAIAKNNNSVLRLTDNALSDGVNQFYGAGFLLNRDGLVVSVYRDVANESTTYAGRANDGTIYQLKYLGSDDAKTIAFFRIITEPNKPIALTPVAVGLNQVQLGQSVISFDGVEKNAVLIGRVAGIDMNPETKEVNRIQTDIRDQARIGGAPLFNLNGEVVGIRVSLAEGSQTFLPIFAVRKEIAKFPLK